MNTSVSFELAKLLKEKGFDDECKYYYDEDEELNFHIGFIGDVWRNSEIKDGLPYNKENHRSPCVSAPTITEVIMWLHEKHKIWLSVEWENNAYRCTIQSTTSRYRNVYNILPNFSSPTKAYEAALLYTFKKLIP